MLPAHAASTTTRFSAAAANANEETKNLSVANAKRAKLVGGIMGDAKGNFSACQQQQQGANGFRMFGGGAATNPTAGGGGATGSGGARKLVIKNFKAKPTLPDNFEQRSLEKLRKAVVAIQRAERIDTSLEELYQAVEDLCSHGKAEQVYSSLKDLVESHVQDCVKPFLGESLDKLIFMKEMNECWSSHCQQVRGSNESNI